MVRWYGAGVYPMPYQSFERKFDSSMYSSGFFFEFFVGCGRAVRSRCLVDLRRLRRRANFMSALWVGLGPGGD